MKGTAVGKGGFGCIQLGVVGRETGTIIITQCAAGVQYSRIGQLAGYAVKIIQLKAALAGTGIVTGGCHTGMVRRELDNPAMVPAKRKKAASGDYRCSDYARVIDLIGPILVGCKCPAHQPYVAAAVNYRHLFGETATDEYVRLSADQVAITAVQAHVYHRVEKLPSGVQAE